MLHAFLLIGMNREISTITTQYKIVGISEHKSASSLFYIPVTWNTELKPIPNFPTLNGSERLSLRLSFCIFAQSSSVNTASL